MAALLRRDMSKPELNDWLHSILHYQNVLRLRRAAITYLPYPAPNAAGELHYLYNKTVASEGL